ncbi:MAG TPA: outer membrane protein assembly factor BamD [Bacteroidota bacterium]|nr:outer membrane protein assembly factor BamD [Bacteroidota bacterium]
MRSFPVFRFLFSILLLTLSFFNGCSFFSSVGDSISDGYQNTVAYFNSYYNARRAFDDAEAEIAAADQLSGIRGFTDKPQPLPNTTRPRLTIVIDKCSNILQFYPSSALVDDALMLIGKSYYYQGDYLKAERKFTEFFSVYPNSPLNFEARLWYIKTLARLKKDDQAIEEGEFLLPQTEAGDETDLAAAVSDVLGVLYERVNRHDRSLAMYDRLKELGADDETRAWALFRAGEQKIVLNQPEDAAEMFRRAAENTDDRQIQYRCHLEYIRTLRSLGRLDESLGRLNEMLDNFRFAQNSREIVFERGVTYRLGGQIELAVDDFTEVDTTSGRSELGSKASFELARLSEYTKGDYRAARDSYGRSTAFPVPEFIAEARRKQSGFTRYFSLNDARAKLDSVIAVESLADSLPLDTTAATTPRLNLDSLRSAFAVNCYEMGELFYIDIENPDSAVFWYKEALKGIDDSVRTPRITYILAELALSNASRGYGDGNALLRSIIETYPKSVYAMRAKIQLGVPLEPTESDDSEMLYKKAEATIDSGNYSQAISTLKKITSDFPLSPFAAKSAYTVGWLYEHRLSQPDSALNQYTVLLQTYSSSPYAARVRPRIRAIQLSRTDTTSTGAPLEGKKSSKREE